MSQVLGLRVENEDPLPKNLPNLGMMHHAAAATGNWINLIVCPIIQASCRYVNGCFTTMAWQIIAESHELKLFKVSNFYLLH